MVVEGLVLDRPASVVNLGIARGTYTEIVEIVAPASATAGELVNVTVRVKNIDLVYDHVVACVALYDSKRFIDLVTLIPSGETHSFPGSFTMPNKDVTIYAWSYYPFEKEWIVDDSSQKKVRLAEIIGWELLDTATVMVSPVPPPPVGWELLDTATVMVSPAVPPPPVGWELLDTAIVMVSPAPPPPVGWELLDTATVSIASGPIPPQYELIQHVIEPWAYFYEGPAEVASFSFTLPIGTTWLAIEVANKFADELEKNGSTLLEGKFYKDASDLITDRYRVDITATLPVIGTIGWAIPWNLIGWAAVAALVALIIYWAVNWIKSVTFSPKPLSEEVKAKWERGTLISMVTDLRPEMPSEDLEGMSDQELRDLLDKIYEEEVPPRGIPWWGWAIISGVGIAGGALALRFLPKKKRE